MSGFFAELRRRNVIRVGIFYAVGSWLVLQVADVLFGLIGVPDWSLRLVGGILLLGFPFALVLAWAFELTPEGLKREKDVDRSQPATTETGKKLDVAIIVMLAVAIGVVALDRYTRAPEPAATSDTEAARTEAPAPVQAAELSIAVLPFVNMSGDPENEYFSDGLSVELLNVLAKIDDFRVAGRTSSFAFKGKDQDLRAIGEKLDVVHILEGSVRKQGNTVRVTAQLIDARNGYHLWSDTYDRQLDDVFAIQDEIAMEVVKALKTTLLVEDQQVIQGAARGDVEAYNHYLKGEFHARFRTREGLERALEEFQKAILVDPSYAPPYAGVAMVYALFDNYGYRQISETKELAEKAIERALRLSPDSDEAWAVKGLYLSQLDDAAERREETKAALERAIEINPNNALAHLWLAGVLFPDFEAMGAKVQRAYELDPLHPVILRRQANRAIQAHDEAAIRRWESELKAVAPDWYMTWQTVADIAAEKGRVADQVLAFERVTELNPEYLDGFRQLAFSLDLLGYQDRTREVLERAARRFATEDLAESLASVEARSALSRGDFEAAAEVYGRAVAGLEKPAPDWVANLALLEVGAGRPEEAERRLREILGPAGDSEAVGLDNLLAWYVLANTLVAQGRTAEAAPIGEQAIELFDALIAQGVRFNYIPFGRGLVRHLDGDLAAMEQGVRESIAEGWRASPEQIAWTVPLAKGSPELARAVDAMREVLAEERARYEAAKAAGGAAN
jgi:TolB-like protein/predicted TPR repeat methyltransferase